MKHHTLIAGCGYVGSRLAELLLEKGQQVTGVRRHWPLTPSLGLNAVEADLTNKNTLKDIKGITHIVYAASAGHYSDEAYKKIYVDGLTNLIELTKNAYPDLQRFIFVSSTGIFGQGDGEIVDEASALSADAGFAASRLREAESLLASSGLPSLSVRFSGIYGPGRQSLLESVKDGTARLAPNNPTWTNRIHLEDCASALDFLLNLQDPDSVYVCTDDQATLKDEILVWLAKELGLPTPPNSDFIPSKSRGNRKALNHRLKAAGYNLIYPTYKEGFGSLIRGMRS